MDGNEVITVLKEIRDEVRQTNGRVDQTNTRLESLEGRFEFLERRVSKGFDQVGRKFDEIETRLVPEIVSVAGLLREVRDLIEHKLEDHAMVVDHERRLGALEVRDAARHPK